MPSRIYNEEYMVIPSEIFGDENLTQTAKLLFPIISILTHAGEHEICCNQGLSCLIGKSEATTKRAIKNLVDRKYIRREIVENEQGQWTRRFTINVENVFKGCFTINTENMIKNGY